MGRSATRWRTASPICKRRQPGIVDNVVEHLFTPGNDGTAENPINFNTVAPGSYDYDGAQYDALSGDDFVILPDVAKSLLPGHAWDYSTAFVAGAGNDVIQGGDGNDAISGSEGDDSLFGGDGDDRLVGASRDDKLAGGDGSDRLTGRSRRDVFIFTTSELGAPSWVSTTRSLTSRARTRSTLVISTVSLPSRSSPASSVAI